MPWTGVSRGPAQVDDGGSESGPGPVLGAALIAQIHDFGGKPRPCREPTPRFDFRPLLSGPVRGPWSWHQTLPKSIQGHCAIMCRLRLERIDMSLLQVLPGQALRMSTLASALALPPRCGGQH